MSKSLLVTRVRGKAVRRYSDAADVATYLTIEEAHRLVSDMVAADKSPESMPSCYISRHVREMYKTREA